MAQNTALQEAIEDLKFMANKQRNPLERIAFNMAITICEQHLPKELDGEQHLKQMINTYEKAGHKIGVPPDELDKDAKVNGMDELKIYRFQALHIEDTFRIVANILKSRSKETCIDRQICKSIEMINGILNKR